MASIAKQPNGRYRARYRDPNGRSRSVTFDRLEDAKRFLRATEGGVVRGDYIDPSRARSRLDTWAELWWQTTVNLRPEPPRDW